MVQDVSTQNTLIFIDDQVPAFEEAPQEHHVDVHGRYETPGAVKAGDLIAWA